ncbi:MAG TPA: putative ABC exporter domain-containing protein [Opitutaceae bacterium]|nr:putative ABC exporter domain-containing protein [Opitutaceae bacterium]
MLGALLYLRLTSVANQARRQALRLRNPRYFAGMIAVIGYFYFFLFRNMHRMPRTGPHGAAINPMLFGATAGILVMMAIWIIGAWIFPDLLPGLRFSAAETAFLFPAPVSRRGLIHFSLASSQFKILFTAVIFGLLRTWTEPSLASFLRHTAGWWVLFSAAELHRVAAGLTYGRIRERGGSVARARALAAAVIALFLAAAYLAVERGGAAPDLLRGSDLAGWLDELFRRGALAWLFWPLRIAAAPYLAADGRAFLLALGPALALIGLHYAWVVGLQVSFEEGSIAQAEKRAQRAAAWSAGGSPFSRAPGKAGRDPFPLAGPGRPEAAFLWKNLLSVGAAVPWSRLAIALAGFAAAVAATSWRHASRGPRPEVLPIVVLAAAAMAAFYTFLIGPQLARQDLRGDLAQMDVLKTYPLAGWQVVGAEMLAPAAILSGVLWSALLAALWAASRLPGPAWLGPGERLVAAACLAALIPLVCALQLLVPNAALLYFPAWHQAGRTRGAGLENMGQRLIFVFGQLLSFLLLLLPAALLGGLLFLATQWLIGAAALALAAAAAAVILGAELWCGVWLLGQRFERYDLSHESL